MGRKRQETDTFPYAPTAVDHDKRVNTSSPQQAPLSSKGGTVFYQFQLSAMKYRKALKDKPFLEGME